jgi:L-threonylcarbamoyladenylate synthase
MKSMILRAGQEEIDEALIDTLSGILLDDGLMVYPTETFYGLGAACFSGKAVRRIYKLKKREAGKPLSFIVSDLEMVETVAAAPPDVFRRLASEFWPGPLTLVLKAAESFPEEILGPGGTIAIRIPPVPWLRALVAEIGQPITATSANVSGQGEISDPIEAIALFSGKVDIIVDGGKTSGGLPSTIVDLAGDIPRIIREGAVPARVLEPFLGRPPSA